MDVVNHSRAGGEILPDDRNSAPGQSPDEIPDVSPNEIPCSDAEKRGLLLVGLLKLVEGVFFIAVGAGALHLIHKNLGEFVMHFIDALPIDPEGRFVSIVMDKADLIDAHDLRRIGAGAFIYACTRIVEGTGLILRKTWAEYFTVILTTLGLPVELFELMHRFTWLKVGALAANLVILAFLLWILKRRQGALLQTRTQS